MQWLTYGPFRGPYLYPLSPHCNSGSYSPSPFCSQTPYWIFFPPGPGQFPSPLFPCVFLFHILFFLFHFHFCCHFVSPLLIPLLLTNFFSFFFFPLFLCFLLFPIGSFSALPLLLRHFSSCPSLLQFITKRLHPPSVSQCYWIVHCSHLLPLLDFLLSFSSHYYVPWSPGLHMVILPWSSTGLWHLLPPLYFLLYVIYYHFYWCFLVCSLF